MLLIEKDIEELIMFYFVLPNIFGSTKGDNNHGLSWFLNKGIKTVRICNKINRDLYDERVKEKMKKRKEK